MASEPAEGYELPPLDGPEGSSGLIAPRDDVAMMEGYYSPQLEVEVRLNTNEAPEAPPAGFVEELRTGIDGIAFNRYPDREAMELRRAVAELHGVTLDEVYCANGSNEVLQSLLLAYGGPGRAVALFEPTYALHSHIARVTGTAVISGRRDEEYLIEEGELDRVLSEGARDFGGQNPVLTFVCSPNNPTGRVEPTERIVSVLERAPGLVVVDEAYGQFAPNSALELREGHDNLVVVRTFSKTWSLASLRLGYAIARPEVVEALFVVTLPYHLDSLKQLAGRLALAYRDDMVERVERLKAERARLMTALSSMALEVCPSDANFILFRPRARDAKEVWSDLLAASVLVRDISTVPHLEGFLRVTIGNPEENDAFLAALRASLA